MLLRHHLIVAFNRSRTHIDEQGVHDVTLAAAVKTAADVAAARLM